ncbi:hypothetical protein P171DRAFT_157559 [Karstenula rhodostoma CBS 690.94]|uniref:DUF7580 domain-containing protein n=1 Tax=Karstenula rhodostoma CBS 690.94 TaxID=1392251 RepID=A0A9P4P7Q2_9PLEO|nr:hypothetical protein P171DRAFT_157559 [Karstenula rhodostoma CBS 690.94]
MSGIEVAGLVFGIVPVVVEILKSYSVAKDRLKSVAHHVQVVYDVQLRYRVAATNFGNDCQLLLRSIIKDPRELCQMVDDPKHSAWGDSSLEERLRQFLGRDCEVFEKVVVRIRDVLRETGTRLSQLGQDLLAVQHDSRLTLKRLYTAFDISSKENAYRRSLDDLDQWNTKLGHLRAQRCKLHKQRSYYLDGLVRKSVPKRYSDIRTSSQKLHDSLRESWSCTNISHVGHQAKLSLDAEAEHDTTRLDMVIACRRKETTDGSDGCHRIPAESPIWLQVRSITSNEPPSHIAPKSPAILDNLSSSLQVPSILPTTIHTAPGPSSVLQKVKKTLKRVRFDASAAHNTPPNSPPRKLVAFKVPEQSSAVTFAMLNLRATSSVCCHLSKACQSPPCKDISLGYLELIEAPHSFRFMFYDAGRNTEANVAKNTPGKDSYSIRMELAKLQTLHQLTLAHKLATAVLQYHSTSWLSQDWGLEDISYFADAAPDPMDKSRSAEDQLAKYLQTLHLSAQFPSSSSLSRLVPISDPEELSYMYGIRNLTLARLGVAFLEIASKKELIGSDLDPSVPVPHRIISARKLLREEPPSPSLSMLGRRYIKMARKCIDCDFSSGEDLTDEALRSAVYTDVVCALEDMIADWKKFMA